jgi:glycine/D-amino acid oxidase-like deaminating enzyme/nitrite reductase/ring-hydroxylating ferredoxin subunit
MSQRHRASPIMMDQHSKHTGITQSIWMATSPAPEFGALDRDVTADVVVVGAGISGLSTAYLLGRAGKSVVVIDTGPILSGETERTTAHLASALDDRFYELEHLHGSRAAQLAAQSHAAAIDEIERIIGAEQIDCDFARLDGFLFAAAGEDRAELERELAAARRVGFAGVELVDRAPLPDFDTGPALRFPRQGQFHPTRYLAGVAAAIVRDGGQIFTHTKAQEIQGGKSAHVRTAQGHTIRAAAVVVATNTPVNDRVVIHTKQAPYRTYVIGASIPAGAVPLGLYWDTADPYHYVRLQRGSPGATQDVLIVGGEDHKTGQADDGDKRYARLERWTRERFPISDIVYRWSGQVMEPVDGLAFIGRNPLDADNVYIATGDSGHGMTHGTIAGMLISDQILGRSNAWTGIYNPDRVTPQAAPEFAQENTNMASQYRDWLTPGSAKDASEIPPDTGAVVRQGLTKVAIYRDPTGALHECSAVCPHLGGIVTWNHSEKMWECPVHGSRFDRFGQVVNGPALTYLESAARPAPTKSEA